MENKQKHNVLSKNTFWAAILTALHESALLMSEFCALVITNEGTPLLERSPPLFLSKPTNRWR